MQQEYTTDNRQPVAIAKLVSRLAAKEGIPEEEAAPKILGGELLARWQREHAEKAGAVQG